MSSKFACKGSCVVLNLSPFCLSFELCSAIVLVLNLSLEDVGVLSFFFGRPLFCLWVLASRESRVIFVASVGDFFFLHILPLRQNTQSLSEHHCRLC
jgi:hypothetical protein